MKKSDMRITEVKLYFLPVETRIPLKFGPEVLTCVTCARVCIKVENKLGEIAEGWGETPLSVQWVWPSMLGYEYREHTLRKFCLQIQRQLYDFQCFGHAFELGYDFQREILPLMIESFNKNEGLTENMPYLAALVCLSPFDLAMHDAYGQVNRKPIYETYNAGFMNRDLAYYLKSKDKNPVDFTGLYPAAFLRKPAEKSMQAWHLVGGKDLLSVLELTGSEPKDGYPVVLSDWIMRDGLKCLKVKLTGSDSKWDYNRLVAVGRIAIEHGVDWLSADFNCQVTECAYVNDILDKLLYEESTIYKMILYVEQPFPYDLEKYSIDVRSVSARKPLFMDESAHDWRLVQAGRELGWTGVALKTCKTQTGALLSMCWAKAHGMTLMVQDLTNPMLAQITHVLLASHIGTIMGIETNSMQFYPEASSYEARIHPGIYKRKGGRIYLESIQGNGFGYRLEAIGRPLPEQARYCNG